MVIIHHKVTSLKIVFILGLFQSPLFKGVSMSTYQSYKNCDRFGSCSASSCPHKTIPEMKSFMMEAAKGEDVFHANTSSFEPNEIKQIDDEFCSDCLAFIPLK
jgi:hypothetical protein